MKINIYNLQLILLVIFLSSSFQLNAQLNFTVNSLADDEYSYAWDDPNTPEDESIDGICNDELGRCTLRAAIDESNNMSQPLDLIFSVNGTINLMDILYPVNGSIINGGKKVELSGGNCFEIDENTQIAGIIFNNVFNAITITGKQNKIGGVLNGNVFTNCYVALEIDGDSNEVFSNYFGLDTNKVLQPNQVSIMIFGNYNRIGRPVATESNTICGSQTGISISEGESNEITNNFIGTTVLGDLGLGNAQGIVIGGSDQNIIGGETLSSRNIISGNSVQGIGISGVPPDSHSFENLIKNNIIGLNDSQSLAIPNGIGITILNGVWNVAIEDNIIAGNTLSGIEIFGQDQVTETSGHLITNNNIGISNGGIIFPNGQNGINIWGNVIETIIGADYSGGNSPNKIIGNHGYGIYVADQFSFNPHRISVRGNLIYQNSTANLFISPVSNNGILPPYNLSYSNNTIAGIHDTPGAIIDIYKANINESAPSAYLWLGSTTVGNNGVFSFEITDPSVEAVSLTATTDALNTSNFARLNIVTAIEKEEDNFPNEFSLNQNYPNPFNPATTISFSIPNEQLVSLKVFNSLGEEVANLVNENKPMGNYSVTFDASRLTSGVYLYKISAGNFVESKKMILLK